MNGIPLSGTGAQRGQKMSRMKKQGLVPGASDLKLSLPRGGYHGMVLEVKTTKGSMTKAQVEYLEDYRAEGWRAECGKGFEQCWEIIEDYMSKDIG